MVECNSDISGFGERFSRVGASGSSVEKHVHYLLIDAASTVQFLHYENKEEKLSLLL